MGAVWLAVEPDAVRWPSAADWRGQRRGAPGGAGPPRSKAIVDRPASTGAVRIYDLAEEDGNSWIVMEALGGRTLKPAGVGPLPLGPQDRLGLGLLEVLEATIGPSSTVTSSQATCSSAAAA